jgi:cholesterol transport system auxiliary component
MAPTVACSRGLRFALALALSALLAACTFTRPESDVPTSYDFGPPPAFKRSNPSIPGTVLVAPVRAPGWLDDSGIIYRLLYEDASRTQSYALSKWAADPATLITDRLRSRLAAISRGVVTPGFSAQTDYTLRVELEDFSQHFRAPGESRASLRARATLLSTEGRRLLAQRNFDVERHAAPNAPGAVKALTEATDVFLEDLVKWLADNAKEATKESDDKKP